MVDYEPPIDFFELARDFDSNSPNARVALQQIRDGTHKYNRGDVSTEEIRQQLIGNVLTSCRNKVSTTYGQAQQMSEYKPTSSASGPTSSPGLARRVSHGVQTMPTPRDSTPRQQTSSTRPPSVVLESQFGDNPPPRSSLQGWQGPDNGGHGMLQNPISNIIPDYHPTPIRDAPGPLFGPSVAVEPPLYQAMPPNTDSTWNHAQYRQPIQPDEGDWTADNSNQPASEGQNTFDDGWLEGAGSWLSQSADLHKF